MTYIRILCILTSHEIKALCLDIKLLFLSKYCVILSSEMTVLRISKTAYDLFLKLRTWNVYTTLFAEIVAQTNFQTLQHIDY